MSGVLKYGLLFIGLLLLQVLILNNILFLGFINPYLYIYFILILPSSVNKDITLLLGFCLGLMVDIFCGSIGCHAFATTLLAYLKPHFQKVFGPREDYEAITPSFRTFGMKEFLQYTSILVLIHQLAYFFAEAFTFTGFFQTLLKAICCAIFTILFIYIIEKLKYKR
ncbi:MAG: rod shape-determining protein MreD [Paludibacteraceae bacterium]|nr:rod shape-determining protein MreD [Paludibacteraceae bacterium]